MLRQFKNRLPDVDPSAYVDESAQVIGDVTIGAESSVWMNVVMRGDVHSIRVGCRSNVQDATIIHVMRDRHPTVIGDDVTIGHGAIIHGCTIGSRVLVGMGTLILNGAVIGDDVILAAGSLITEGSVIPPRSLVMGRPGRVRRPLTDADVASIRGYAENYVRYRKDYA
ncbi:MAG TPA: gamma carbonic anhydrase family protein [Vicinamibacterales bacterium]